VPDYYSQKNAAEQKLGRSLSNEEFEHEHLVIPDGYDTLSKGGTSIFDPVLCELAYRWWSPPNGVILDPFAGGSVRGIVAGLLGRRYVGVDLRAEQIEANREQAKDVCPNADVKWLAGDSREVITTDAVPSDVDFIFSCPPYADLEVYSDDPADISAMDFPEFLEAYRAIIAASVEKLANNRFACIVIGDARDKKGMYYNLIGETVRAFIDAGCSFYNEAILVTSVGSLPIRIGRIFPSGRKLGKTHQNVLVFVKGNPKKAAEACGEIEVALPDALIMQAEDGDHSQ
jgi:DNA modification methylase